MTSLVVRTLFFKYKTLFNHLHYTVSMLPYRAVLVLICAFSLLVLLVPATGNAQKICENNITFTQGQNTFHASCSEQPRTAKLTVPKGALVKSVTELRYRIAGITSSRSKWDSVNFFNEVEESHSDSTGNEEKGDGKFTANPTSSTYSTVYGGELSITVEVINQADYTAKQDIKLFVGGEGPSNQDRYIDGVRDLELEGGETTTITLGYDIPEEPNPNWPSDNEFDFRVTATDGEGSMGITDTTWRPVFVEEVEIPPPNAEFSYSPTPPMIGTSIQFDASDSFAREGTLKSYEWEMGDGTEMSGVSPEFTYEEYGAYEVSLTVSDGENEDTVTKTVVVENSPPEPIFEFETRLDNLTVEDEIRVNAFDSYDPDSDRIDEYRWDFGDGTLKQGSRVSHSYSDPGTYNLTLTVDDGITTSSNSTHISVMNRPPVASLQYSPDEDLTVGDTIKFDASNSHDPDGDVEQYIWEFGNGETAKGEVVEHTYKELGTYEVMLTVDDGGDTDKEEITFTVGPSGESADGFSLGIAVLSFLIVATLIRD